MKDKINRSFKLNMQMLMDVLEDVYEITYFRRRNDTQKLASAEIYYGQNELDSSTVYVAESQVFEKHPVLVEDVCVISIGDCQWEERMCSVIQINTKQAWQKVYNDVSDVFKRYLAWDRELLYILKSGGGVYELTVSAYNFLGNPLYIHDKDFNILAIPTWVVGMGEVEVDNLTGKKTVPLETIQRLDHNPAYRETLKDHKAKLWDPPYAKNRQMYANIWMEEKVYCGRLLIRELNTSFKPSTFILAEHFAKIVAIAIEQDQFQMDEENSIEKMLKQYYLTGKIEESYLLERLGMLGWKRKGYYQCLILELHDNNGLVNIRKVKSTIDIKIQNGLSFIEKNKIYMVYNAQNNVSDNQQIEILKNICNNANISVGISQHFEDFLNVNEYHNVAYKTIEIGKDKYPEKKIFYFKDYVLDYILLHFRKEFRDEVICSQGVQKLQKSDRENHTEYIKTLTTYLNHNGQQTATAQALFIHRSTLMYRMEKIQNLLHMDLNIFENRLYLLISIYILQNEK